MKKVLLFASVAIAAAMTFSCKPDEPKVEASLVLKSQETLEIPADGAAVEVSFVTNQDWTVSSSAEWATVDPAQGKAAETAQKVKVEVAANEADAERTATITVKAASIEKKVTVKQAGKAGATGATPIATALATPGTYTIQGQVLATCTRGAVIADATAAIYVYKADAAAWEVGATYKVTGPTCVFNFGPELNGFDSAEKVSDGTVAAAEPTAITTEVAEAFIAAIDGKNKDKDLVVTCQYVQVEGVLTVSGNYYNVAIPGTEKAVASVSYPAESLGLAALNGKNIQVTGYLTGISGGKFINIVATSVDIECAPAVGISTAADFVAFAAAVAAGDYASYKNAAGEVDVLADLDFTGVAAETANVVKFDGVFNGNNHSIKNLTSNKALFDTLTTNAVVKNLVLDKTCKWEFEKPDPIAALCAVLETGAEINTVDSYATVSFTAGACTATVRCGAIVGRHMGGVVKNCTNYGTVGFNDAGAISEKINFYIGGIAGTVKAAPEFVAVENCVNKGEVLSIRTSLAGHNYVGGVVGSSYQVSKFSNTFTSVGVIKNCHNEGTVKVENKTNANGSYTNVGGVVGYFEGDVEDCTNSGTVTLSSNPDRAASCTRPAIGGVAGVVAFNAKNCVNEEKGVVTIDGVWAAGTADAGGAGPYQNPTLGGVIGAAGLKAKCESVVSGCANKGTFNVLCDMANNGKTETRTGGVVGFCTSKVENCYNSGTVNYKAGQYKNYVAGVAGILFNDITDSYNSGTVAVVGKTDTNTNKPHYQDYVAGVVGFHTYGISITNCENKATGSVSLTGAWNDGVFNYIGGVTGSYDSNGYVTMTGCKNLGSVFSDSACSIRAGGISGSFNGIVDHCESLGTVVIKNAHAPSGKISGAAPMAGYVSAVFTNCVSGGKFEFEGAKGTYSSMFVAHLGTARKADGEHLPWTGNVISCDVTVNTGDDAPYFGVALGRMDKATTKFTLGSAENPSIVKATAKVNGKTVKEYLAGGGAVVGFIELETAEVITDGVVTIE